MIDSSEKRNRQLAFELQSRMFLKSAVRKEKKNSARNTPIEYMHRGQT